MTGKIEQNMQSSQHPHGPQFTDDGRCRWCREQMDTTAEIEALTRRNAELTAAILDYHLFHHGLRREITECAGRLCRRYAALTPTESEAKHNPVSRCECARGTHDVFNSDCPMNWHTESEAK